MFDLRFDLRHQLEYLREQVAPRSILRRQVQAARSLGFTGFAASELEYYLFRNSYRAAAEQGYRSMEPAGWYLEDYHILQGTRTEAYTGAVRHHLKHSGGSVLLASPSRPEASAAANAR